jgi:predicted SAM-dependent methyltransferase
MILELGCGIHKQGDTTVAIDKCPDSQADIIRDFAKRGIPFQDSYFDEVWCFDVIEHIEDYEDLIFTFNEIWRVLKPGGVFKFTTPSGLDNGFSHMTHHRVFFVGGFEYLKSGNSPEWDYMRKSDGILADFELGWIDRGPGVISGKFIAKKTT